MVAGYLSRAYFQYQIVYCSLEEHGHFLLILDGLTTERAILHKVSFAILYFLVGTCLLCFLLRLNLFKIELQGVFWWAKILKPAK